MKLEIARKIADVALAKARELKLKPMALCILDARAAIRFVVAEDGDRDLMAVEDGLRERAARSQQIVRAVDADHDAARASQ